MRSTASWSIALEQAVAAPFCTSRLADAGARVIKIERQGGDLARKYDEVAHGESAYFVWLNRGKESLALDIKAPDDAAVAEAHDQKGRRLRAEPRAGCGGAGGVWRRRPASRTSAPDRLRHHRLRRDGPYAEMKAYDLFVQCETGLASITGSAGRRAGSASLSPTSAAA